MSATRWAIVARKSYANDSPALQLARSTMLLDLARNADLTGAGPDVIIVGAGAVGLSMGVALARTGRRVLLLDAGPNTPGQDSQAYFESATESGRHLDGLKLGRFRALGGTTNFWGGQLVRFDPIVFGQRSWVGDVAWLVDRADIERHYDAAAALLRLDVALQNDNDVWQRLNLPPPGPSDEVVPYLSRWAPEPNFARLFAHAIAHDRNLLVAVGAPVISLVGQGGRLSGVELAGGRQIHAPVTVLTNGTIEMARLLQMPYAGGERPPWHASPWLGRGFMDHLDCHAGRVLLLDGRRFHSEFDNAFIAGHKYTPKLKLSESAQEREALLGIAAHFIFNSSVDQHLGSLKVLARSLKRGRFDQSFSALPGSIAALRFVMPMVLRYMRYHRMYNVADRGITLRLTSEQRPMVTSRVTLRTERDDLGMPLVDVDWQTDETTLETMARFGQLVADYLADRGLATVELDPRLMARDPTFLAAADDANHQMGTARMSRTVETGVVDADLKVHGTQNLYVAGAAVYPGSGFANPTFTAIALGQRLAEHLAHA